MSSDPALNVSIGALDARSRCSLVNKIWGRAWTVGEYQRDWLRHDQPFFAHYKDYLDLALASRYGELIQHQTLRDIVSIIDQVQANKARDEIRQNVLRSLPCGCKDHTEECHETVDCLLALVVRIWLMCNVGVIGDESRYERILDWQDGGLHDLMQSYFSRHNKLKEPFRLEKAFQARNLEKLGGIEVSWTENLLEHLRLYDPSDEGEPYRVLIFYHARFLEYHQDSGIFPEGLIQETIRTLALLLPRYDSESQRWYAKQCSMHSLDPMASECDPLEPEERTTESFNYWRDRLAILKQAYDESEPKTITQWWQDRRRRVQWATFWVAALVLVLTVFFGMIQSIEGALQVYKAYHPS